MAVFPVQAFSKSNVDVAWKASFTSESLNKKFNGLPVGVYLGLTPASVGGSNILTLSVDTTRAISLAAMKATGSNTVVHLQIESTVSLNFVGHATFPVYVVAKASYATGVTTTATISTQVALPNGVDVIGICRVDAMGATPVIASSSAPDRHEPLANTGVAFGFMRGGDIQSVDANNLTTTDVNNAKVDTQSVTHPTLTARLTEDLSGAGISKNLARTLEFVKGNSVSVTSALSANISGSFAKFDRETGPAIDIASGGSESADGAVTTGAHPTTNSTARNVVYLRDTKTRQVPMATSGGVAYGVYGRLSYAASAITGTTSFALAGQAVVGIGTNFTVSCVVGDIIKGGDGSYYEIATITDNLNLALSTAYQGASVAGVTSDRRRFTMTFYRQVNGVETPYTFPSGTLNMFPYIPAFSSLNIARYGATADAVAGAAPARMALTDGTTPFTATQTGVAGVAATDLAIVSQTAGEMAKAPAYGFFNWSGNVANTGPARNTVIFAPSQQDQTADAAYIASLTPPAAATAAVASITAAGIITINRPPAGLMYQVSIRCSMLFTSTGNLTFANAWVIRTANLARISNLAVYKPTGSPESQFSIPIEVTVAIDAGSVLGNVFEIIYTDTGSPVETPTTGTSLVIQRIARLA